MAYIARNKNWEDLILFAKFPYEENGCYYIEGNYGFSFFQNFDVLPEVTFESGPLVFEIKQKETFNDESEYWLVRDTDGKLNIFYGKKPVRDGEGDWEECDGSEHLIYIDGEVENTLEIPVVSYDDEPIAIEIVVKY